MVEGYIKLNRKIFDHWVHKKPEHFKAWIDLIGHVNFMDKKHEIDGEIIECKRGQSTHSIRRWASIFGENWTEQKVRTFFKLLEKDKMIEVEGLRKTTRVNIVNYDTYNGDQRADNEQITNRQRTDNEQITTTELKELKELKKETNTLPEKSGECELSEKEKRFEKFWELYQRKGNKQSAKSAFMKLSEEKLKVIASKIGDYLRSTPDKKYRLDAEKYLNASKEHWNDEIAEIVESKREDRPDVQISSKPKFYGV